MHQHCHHCDYDLMGLPDRGTCPECGEYYDKHSIFRAIRAQEPVFLGHIKWVFLAVFTFMVLMCGGVFALRSDRPWGILALSLIIAGVSGFGSFSYWWAGREERRASE